MQKVIAARDVTLTIWFDALAAPLTIETASNFTANITGNTEDIGAISTDEPIATDNGGNTYDISFSLQEAEALTIKNALGQNLGIVHIRQIVEAATISVHWHKKRAIPSSTTVESYHNCTGVEEGDTIERRSSETIKTWRFRARGMERKSHPGA